ncbi:MAG: hypothetical protein ACRDHY_04805 [Anaerolineales bacterium]
MRAFAASLLAALLLVGCSDADPEETATGTATSTATVIRGQPAVVEPPSGYLKDAGGKPVEGGTGTFCWPQFNNAQMCADLFGTRTNATPMALGAGEDVEFVFDAGLAREVNLAWTAADQLTSSQQGANLDWGPKDGANHAGPSYTQSRTAPTEPGLYVLAVFTRFPEGDVTYGFYIEVR